jgi:translation initiation factor IF-1
MRRYFKWQAAVLTVGFLGLVAFVDGVSGAEDVHPQLLPGDRVLLGTVEEVRSEQAKIDTGEGSPRFVPMGVRKAKNLPDLKKGDRVEITVNEQNLLVDVHVTGEGSHHLIIHGQLAQPLVTGHDKAVIRTTNGKEESHFVRPVARSKVASIPVGVDAVFLIDELNKIVDVIYGDKAAVHRAAELWQKKTPLKGSFNRINVVVLKPLDRNTITVRTEDGKEHPYEVRPLILKRMEKLSKGDEVVLLVDEENKVTDVAILPPSREGTHK